ncbi:MAG: O-antigen ligase family protein [Akkermansiaceae bacterium]
MITDKPNKFYLTVEILVSIGLALSFLYSGVMATTFSSANQSIGVAGIVLSSSIGILVLGRKPRINLSTYIFFVIAWLYFIVRAHFSDVREYANQDLMLILSAGMVFLVQVHLGWSRCVKVGVLSGIGLVFFINLLMFIPQVNSFRDGLLDYANGSPVTGLFNHRNFFSNFMGMVSCFLFTVTFFRCHGLVKIICFLMAFLGFAAVFASKNRGVALAVLVVIFAVVICKMMLRHDSKKQKLIMSLLSVGLIGALMFFGAKLGQERAGELKADNMMHSNGRIECWSMAVSQIPDNMIFGSGSRSFEYKSYAYWSDGLSWLKYNMKFVHNEYLQIMTDYGVIGLILFLILLLSIIIYALTKVLQNKDESIAGWSMAAISVLSVMLIHSCVSFPAHGFVNLITCVYLLGFIFTQIGEDDDNMRTKSSFYMNGIMVIGVFIFSFGVIINSVKAAKTLWNHGIVGDDLNWGVQDADDKDWQMALEILVSESPTFSRWNKLGVIYLDQAESLEESIDYQNVIKKSENAFRNSLKLHGNEPITPYNLARVLILQKKYQEAEQVYLEMGEESRNRPSLLKYDLRLSQLYFNWALEYFNNNDLDKSHEKLENAKQHRIRYFLVMGERYSEDIRNAQLQEFLLESKLNYANGEIEASIASLNQYVSLALNLSWMSDTQIEDCADNVYQFAYSIWLKKRLPTEAKTLFLKSGELYSRISNKSHLQERTNKIENFLEILRVAGF